MEALDSCGPVTAAVMLHPQEFLAHPWSGLHVDFAGPLLGKLQLLLSAS